MKIIVLNSQEDAKRIYGTGLEQRYTSVEYYPDSSFAPDAILASRSPDLVLLSLEWTPAHRLFCAEANRRRIPTLYVMDGVLEWSYIWENQSYVQPHGTVLQPLLAQYLSVIGRHPARILSSMGLKEKISIIGLPRLDSTARQARFSHIALPPTVLICTAKTPDLNRQRRASTVRALKDLMGVIQELELSAVWRISNDFALDLGVTPSKADLKEDILNSNCLVAFPSTVVLEGMLSGLPTAIIEYQPNPLYIETAWQIRCKDNIYPVLNELLYPPAQKIAYQDYCLHEELEVGQASARLDEFIHNIVDGKIQQRETEKRSHGALDFKLVHSQLSSFASSPHAAIQYELDAYRGYKEASEKQMAAFLQTWPVRCLRALRKVPLFRKVNRLLESLFAS